MRKAAGRRLRGLLLAGLVVAILLPAAVALAARVFHGPYRLGSISVVSPLNAQAALGLCAVLLLVYRSRTIPTDHCRAPRGRLIALGALAVAGVAYACFRPRREFYFLSDDYCLLQEAGRYIRDFPIQTGDVFFRPVGYLLVGLIYPWARLDPYDWHLVGALLHATCSALVFLLLQRLRYGFLPAVAGSAIFGLHGSRPEAVVWLAGWFDVFATLFVLAGSLLFLRDLRSPHPLVRVAALLCAAAAMLSKETGFVFPLLLPVLLYMDAQLTKRNLSRIWPFFALAAALFAYRWIRLDGPGGYAPAADAFPLLGATALGMLKALAWRLWAVLCFPSNWSVEPNSLLKAIFSLGIAAAAVVGFCRPERRKIVGAVALVVLSALPAIRQLLIGPDMENSRGLYLPSAGYALLISAALHGILKLHRKIVLASALLVFHFAILQHNLAIWARASALTRETCASVASQLQPGTRRLVAVGLPGSINGVYCFRNCFKECIETSLGRKIEEVELIAIAPAGAPLRQDTLTVGWDPEAQRVHVVHR